MHIGRFNIGDFANMDVDLSLEDQTVSIQTVYYEDKTKSKVAKIEGDYFKANVLLAIADELSQYVGTKPHVLRQLKIG